MSNFTTIRRALEHIDDHLECAINLDAIAERFHFSPFYFHRMFSVIVGKTPAAYIRDRRLLRACEELSKTSASTLDIAMNCGYGSAQSFSRAFRHCYGVSPSEYRRRGLAPATVTVDELIRKFTNRLRGGVLLNPNIIRQNALIIAGVSGDGNATGTVWSAFEAMRGKSPIHNKLSDNGYEIRMYEGGRHTVHVGCAVSGEWTDSAFSFVRLPASQYASFDVYVENGYDSENGAMDEWLRTNAGGYSERLLGDAHYCVEYYDERFQGSESGSIVEIWIPIEKK